MTFLWFSGGEEEVRIPGGQPLWPLQDERGRPSRSRVQSQEPACVGTKLGELERCRNLERHGNIFLTYEKQKQRVQMLHPSMHPFPKGSERRRNAEPQRAATNQVAQIDSNVDSGDLSWKLDWKLLGWKLDSATYKPGDLESVP